MHVRSKLHVRFLRRGHAYVRQKSARAWGRFYDGRQAPELSHEELQLREMILAGSMPHDRADVVLAKLDRDAHLPIYARATLIEIIAAICAKFEREVKRTVKGEGVSVAKSLWFACSADRLEWLINNIRMRQGMSTEDRAFLGSGTSTNEALHAELRSWCTSIHEMHRSTLEVKLRVLVHRKRLAHHVATYFPPARQTREGIILARVLARPMFTAMAWKSWCQSQITLKGIDKARLPLVHARCEETEKVRQWRQRQSCKQKARRIRKRTSFNAKRHSSLKKRGAVRTAF